MLHQYGVDARELAGQIHRLQHLEADAVVAALHLHLDAFDAARGEVIAPADDVLGRAKVLELRLPGLVAQDMQHLADGAGSIAHAAASGSATLSPGNGSARVSAG